MFRRFIAVLVCFTFITSYYQPVYAQDFSINQLPTPGSMIGTTPAYVPLTLKGLVVHPENALKFDFLMDTGHSHLSGSGLSDEALKIMKYFLTALTIPEDDLWVNLSPYEKGRIIQSNFGQTIMGRDLLAQDYILKQLTASLIYPEKALGKEFWQQVYSKAEKEYGTTQIPVNTFNKVWIVPSEAVVWEHDGKVLIVKSHLKVMLEEDYLALNKNMSSPNVSVGDQVKAHSLASNIVRTIILPVLEKEVNEGKNFAQLRQMYQAMILATWYKKALRESILNKVYADKQKVAGIGYKNSVIASEAKVLMPDTRSSSQSNDIELIYHQYLKAFKKGAFNYIKEDAISIPGLPGKEQGILPRKYFSGGFSLNSRAMTSFAEKVLVLKGSFLDLPAAYQPSVLAASKPTAEGASMVLVKADVTEASTNQAMLSQSISDYVVTALAIVVSLIFSRQHESLHGDEWTFSQESREIFWAMAQAKAEQAENSSEMVTLSGSVDHQKAGDVADMVRRLGDLRDKSNIKVFLNILKDKRKEVGLAAAEAILDTGGYKHEDVLRELLKWYWKYQHEVRGNVFQFLDVAIKYKNGFDIIFDPQGTDQNEILYIKPSNQTMFDNDILSFFLTLVLTSSKLSNNVKRTAAGALGIIGKKEHVINALRREDLKIDPSRILEARELLGDGKGLSNPAMLAIKVQINDFLKTGNVDEIIKILNGFDPGVRYFAMKGIDRSWPLQMRLKILEVPIEYGDVCIWGLRGLLDYRRIDMNPGLILEIVERYLKHENALVRIVARDVLDYYGSADNGALKSILINALDNPYTDVRQWATAGINKLLDLRQITPEEKIDIDRIIETRQKIVASQETLTVDAAMLHNLAPYRHLGGITLNAKMMDLQIRRDGHGVPLPISQQPLDEINIQGFVPRIISIQPVDLSILLGLTN